MKFSLNLLLLPSYSTNNHLTLLSARGNRVVWQKSRLLVTNKKFLVLNYRTNQTLRIHLGTSVNLSKNLISLSNKKSSPVAANTQNTFLFNNKAVGEHIALISSLLQVYASLPTLLTLVHFNNFLNLKLLYLPQQQFYTSKFQYLRVNVSPWLQFKSLHLL